MKYRIVTLVALMGLILASCGGEKSEGDKKEETSNNTEDTSEVKEQPKTNNSAPSGDFKIAFVNVDSLSLKYKRLRDAEVEIREIAEQGEQKLRNMEANFQREMAKLQEEYVTMLKSQQEAAEKKLTNMRANLEREQAMYQQNLQTKQAALMEGAYKTLYSFLDVYAQENGYDFILTQTYGSGVLYGNSAYDVTQDVVAGLNKLYEESLDPSAE